MLLPVIPAALNSGAGQAGIQCLQRRWIPAFAGMTSKGTTHVGAPALVNGAG